MEDLTVHLGKHYWVNFWLGFLKNIIINAHMCINNSTSSKVFSGKIFSGKVFSDEVFSDEVYSVARFYLAMFLLNFSTSAFDFDLDMRLAVIYGL